MSLDLPQQDLRGGVVRPGVVVDRAETGSDLRHLARGVNRVGGLPAGNYLMAWESVEIPVKVAVRDGLLVAIPPSGRAFPVTACPGAIWRRK